MNCSIVIATYNRAADLRETLTSLAGIATTHDWEVIVVNDGSPDDTASVLQPLVEAGKIRYIEQANQGQGAARNRGLAVARGEFFLLQGSDCTERERENSFHDRSLT